MTDSANPTGDSTMPTSACPQCHAPNDGQNVRVIETGRGTRVLCDHCGYVDTVVEDELEFRAL